MSTTRTRRNDLWPLALLVIAALLRFSNLGEIQHNVDQAYPIWQALRTLEHGEWPLLGQGTSVLFANPALTGYLYLPFVAAAHSPLGAYLLVITLNSLAVPLAYLAAKELRGRAAGLIAALLMAVNPWVIEYSRATWVQSLLPFFTCALAWLLWPVLLGRSANPARRTLLALVVLTLMTQTYLLAYLAVVPVGLLVLIYRRRVPRRALLAGGAIFTAATLVYGVGLLTQADVVQQDVSQFASSPPHLSAEAWTHAVRLISGADYPLARGQNAPIADSALRQNLTQIGHYGMWILLLAGIGLALNAVRTGRDRDPGVIVLVWFGLPVLLMSYVGQPVHPFYQLLGLPAGYALVGWFVNALPQKRLRVAVAALLIPFAALMIVNSQRFAQATAAAPGAHDLGALPLNVGLQLGRAVMAHLPPGGIVYAEVDEWTLNSLAGTTFPLLRDTRAPECSIVPREGGVYIFSWAVLPPDWHGPAYSTGHAQIPLPDGVTLTVDAFPPDAAQQVAPPHALNITSEDGLTLLGYDLEPHPPTPSPSNGEGESSAGETGVRFQYVLTTYWRVDALQPDTAGWFFAPFAQVFDESGAELGVVQGATVPGREWRVGDVHIQRMTLPAGTARIALGQYDGPRQHNMIFLPDYTPLIDVPLG